MAKTNNVLTSGYFMLNCFLLVMAKVIKDKIARPTKTIVEIPASLNVTVGISLELTGCSTFHNPRLIIA
jgi:hypothetical protein